MSLVSLCVTELPIHDTAIFSHCAQLSNLTTKKKAGSFIYLFIFKTKKVKTHSLTLSSRDTCHSITKIPFFIDKTITITNQRLVTLVVHHTCFLKPFVFFLRFLAFQTVAKPHLCSHFVFLGLDFLQCINQIVSKWN